MWRIDKRGCGCPCQKFVRGFPCEQTNLPRNAANASRRGRTNACTGRIRQSEFAWSFGLNAGNVVLPRRAAEASFHSPCYRIPLKYEEGRNSRCKKIEPSLWCFRVFLIISVSVFGFLVSIFGFFTGFSQPLFINFFDRVRSCKPYSREVWMITEETDVLFIIFTCNDPRNRLIFWFN